VNLFINGTADLTIQQQPIRITQKNNYPWDGNLSFTIQTKTASQFALRIRIPGWAQNQAMPSQLYRFTTHTNTAKTEIKINGQSVTYSLENGYVMIERNWKNGDQVEVDLPMEIQKLRADTNLADNIGKLALQRGPIVYCAEWADNYGKTANLLLPENTVLTAAFKPGLLNGVTVLQGEVPAVVIENNSSISTKKQSFTAIPYYSWANRGQGEMMVWFPSVIKEVSLISK
jgi:hypothetical protein